MPTSAVSPTFDNLSDLPLILEHTADWSRLRDTLQAGRAGVVDGAWGSSAALAAATLGRHAPSTLLVVIAHPRDLDAWADDLASFGGAPPTVFPAWDSLPTGETMLDDIAVKRLRVLKMLARSEPPRLLLTTVQALIQPVPDRAALDQGRRVIKVGEMVDPEELSAWLVGRGYRRSEVVELPGEFGRRGGILDVFPPDADAPFRLEFFGDEVESIREYAPQTQRSLGTVPTAELTAANLEV